MILNLDNLLIEELGYNTYRKGENYLGDVYLNDSTINGNLKYYKFSVESERNYNYYYSVTIIMHNNRIFRYMCNCPECVKNHKCKHIAAAFINYKDEIFNTANVDPDIEFSKEILELFNTNQESNNIKEKLNLEVELDFTSRKKLAYLSVGLKKTYVIKTERKLDDFMDAYYNNLSYKFGVNFTYDPKKHFFSDEDKKILEFLFEYKKSESNSYYYYYYQKDNPFELSEREFKTFLNLLNNKKVNIKNYGIINEIKEGIPTDLNLNYIDNKYELYLDEIDKYMVLDEECKYIAYDNILYILPNNVAKLIKLCDSKSITKLTFEKDSLNLFKNGLLPKIKNDVKISDNVEDILILGKPDISLYFDLEKDKISCKIKLDYKGNIIDYFDNNEKIVRDEIVEKELINDLLSLNFNINKKTITLDDIDDIGSFISEGLKLLSDKYKIYTTKKIDSMKILKKSNVKSNFSIGQDAIMSYKFDVDNIDLKELNSVLNSLKNNKKYYKLKNGNIIDLYENKELQELNNIFDDLEINGKDITDGNIEIPKYRAFYIDSLKNNKYKSIKTDNSFDRFIKNFESYKNIDIEFDEKDSNILRDYQKEGVKWLYTLYKCDLGGILADEMGLGKSLQTICFIKQILKEKEDAKIMIVCPTSLVYNWKKEFDKFAPELKYVTVSESKSKRKEIMNNFDKYNIFITSYGLVRNDNDEYENKNFELCVIDEAQAIKNYQANMTKEVKKIKARTKIALTGTPLENSVLELWSIFDFIMPGYLNSILKFKEKYGIKDVDDESLSTLKNLNYQIKPFILRRKKKDVSKELPDKIENDIYLELPDFQKALYLKTLKNTQKTMDEIIASEGFTKARFEILKLITKLRQICIDPQVLFENYNNESIKMEKLLEVVKSYVKEGHKILIFSSFKTVVNNVKEMLDKESISSYVITGSVKGKDRMNLVESFNKDDTNCFLITLKAGGTGLNLTSADVVIHLDIWWNPQVENQATDRTHRIGQKNKVTVIRLITKGTIEERIVELQTKKKILSDNLIEGKANSTISTITEEEMKELLSYGEDE